MRVHPKQKVGALRASTWIIPNAPTLKGTIPMNRYCRLFSFCSDLKAYFTERKKPAKS